VDTRELQKQVASITDSDLDLKRKELGIKTGDRIALFCGILHPVKSVPFLIDCAKIIKHQVPTFHLLLVGGGPDHNHVKRLIANMQWIHLLGPKFGRDKAIVFKLAEMCVLPGRVGLVILDCFATGLPLFTVQTPIHGPEVEYLEEGVNGFIVQKEADVYAATVAGALGNEVLLGKLRQGATASAAKYSIEAMVENFRAGIVACLESPIAEGVA
jgi:glycosyltransferase involved in cell wall biosynthesis